MTVTGNLGRRKPTDFKHVERFPFATVQQETVAVVNHTLLLPSWHWTHDQGQEGSCVGHGSVMERAIVNTAQNRLLALLTPTRRYDPISVWNAAKEIDEWPDTNPGDDNGTSVRAAYDVMRVKGAPRCKSMTLVDGKPFPVALKDWDPAEGVLTNRWATTVDEIRTALSQNKPVTIGVNWYSNFDNPVSRTGRFGREEFWIGSGALGRIRGGHCVCIYGASDDRQAFRVKNSWGRGYPLVWLTYTAMAQLLHEDGEAALVTDR